MKMKMLGLILLIAGVIGIVYGLLEILEVMLWLTNLLSWGAWLILGIGAALAVLGLFIFLRKCDAPLVYVKGKGCAEKTA